MLDTFLVGLFSIIMTAVAVSVGTLTLIDDAREKSCPHGLPSPATPPVESTQPATMSAREFNLLSGTILPTGTLMPGERPVLGLASTNAVWTARFRASLSCCPEPIAFGEFMNGANAATVAMVVTSLICSFTDEESEPHCPTRDMRLMALFGLWLLLVGLPFVATA